MGTNYKKVPFFKVFDNLGEGDIVLFRTERTISKLQRFVCNSDYDHIGLVVVWEDCDSTCCSDRLKRARRRVGTPAWHTLEADADNGVTLHRLTPACLSAYNGQVFIRHLNLGNITDAQHALMCAALHRFVDAVLGAPYERSMSKIIRAANFFGELNRSKSLRASGSSSASLELNEELDSITKKNNLLLNPFEMRRLPVKELPSVFCSELVAAALIVMGLLPRDERDPGLYIPKDFSVRADEGRSLEFCGDFSLGEELEIDWSDLSLENESNKGDDVKQMQGRTSSEQLSSAFKTPSTVTKPAPFLKAQSMMYSTTQRESMLATINNEEEDHKDKNGTSAIQQNHEESAVQTQRETRVDSSESHSGASTPSRIFSSGYSTPIDSVSGDESEDSITLQPYHSFLQTSPRPRPTHLFTRCQSTSALEKLTSKKALFSPFRLQAVAAQQGQTNKSHQQQLQLKDHKSTEEDGNCNGDIKQDSSAASGSPPKALPTRSMSMKGQLTFLL